MSLTVDVLPLAPLPLVRARVESTGPWALYGESEGRRWKVAEGVGDRWLSDPWAPVNVATTYTLTAGGSVESAGPAMRPYSGESALTDLAGRGVVDFRWHDGDDQAQDPRHVFFDVPGAALSPYLSADVAGAGGGAFSARTSGAGTVAMRALVAANDAVILHHNQALCRVPGCDVDPVRTVLLTAAPERRTGHVDRATREWSLSYRLVPQPWGYVPPVATVADYVAMWPTVGDVQASGLTVGDIESGGWLVDL